MVALLALSLLAVASLAGCSQSAAQKMAASYDEAHASNAEVIAWLTVEGTSIDAPVCQEKKDDSFYQTHDATKESSTVGAPYIQKLNAADFSDPATIVYGTTEGEASQNSAAFTELHQFESEDFFSNNGEIKLYTPGHLRTYQVAAATTFGTRHLMSLYDFASKKGRKQFAHDLTSGGQLATNLDESLVKEIANGSPVLILSTGNTGMMAGSSCYLVVAVQTEDEELDA